MKPLQKTLWVLLAMAALGCTAPSRPALAGQEGAAGQVPVLMVAWNVANLFDDEDAPYHDTVLSPEDFSRKVDEVASVLGTLDADFVALEEVENLACLTALNSRLVTPYPQLGLLEGNDRDRGIDVAFLSRIPVSRVISHRDHDLPDEPGISRRYKFSRDCLEVVLDTSPPVTVLVNHFKSQLGSKKDAAAKRHAQSGGVVAIAAEIAARRPEGLELVMGDLNDDPRSWSLEPLFQVFVDVFDGWPEKLRGSHRSRHGRSSLDHILISADGVARVERAYVYQDLGKPTSDHDPVGLTLRLDQAPSAAPARCWSETP